MVGLQKSSETTAPSIDQRVFLHGVPWAQYESLLQTRGEASVPRISYLCGELELMSPSVDHEVIHAVLGRLVEAYAEHEDLDLWPAGSWTIKREPDERGAEPDECYTLGDPRKKNVPDLAIEVIWTSGGIDKLEIYRGLGVPEVWFWHDEQIDAYVLADGTYQSTRESALLPGLDLQLIARLAVEPPRNALRTLRSTLG